MYVLEMEVDGGTRDGGTQLGPLRHRTKPSIQPPHRERIPDGLAASRHYM